jgi:predicted AAA+ superfamily ATPase
VDHKTVTAQLRILEDLFLVSRLQPWHTNLGSRQVKTPSYPAGTAPRRSDPKKLSPTQLAAATPPCA